VCSPLYGAGVAAQSLRDGVRTPGSREGAPGEPRGYREGPEGPGGPGGPKIPKIGDFAQNLRKRAFLALSRGYPLKPRFRGYGGVSARG